MLFNLTRMRVSKFDKYVYQYRKQYGSSLRGDQDILSIYRYNYPGECLYEWIAFVQTVLDKRKVTKHIYS